MSFQDELNALKNSCAQTNETENIVQPVKEALLNDLRNRAKSCNQGEALNFDYALRVPFDSKMESYRPQGWIRDQKMVTAVTPPHNMRELRELLQKALSEYGLSVGDYSVVSGGLVDEIYLEFGTKLNHQLYVQAQNFDAFKTEIDPYSPFRETLKEYNCTKDFLIVQNGREFKFRQYGVALVLPISFREQQNASSSCSDEKRIVACPSCGLKCKVPVTQKTLEVTCKGCGKKYRI